MQIGARIEDLESQAAALTASAVDRDPKDALIIQMVDAGAYKQSDLPLPEIKDD